MSSLTDTSVEIHREARRNFNPLSKLLHWIMAAIIIVAWIVGYYGGAMLHYGVNDAETAQKIWAITLHKSIATTTLFLIVLRIVWRMAHRPPALGNMPKIMKHFTHLGHAALYFLMVAVPVSVGRTVRPPVMQSRLPASSTSPASVQKTSNSRLIWYICIGCLHGHFYSPLRGMSHSR